MVQADGMAAQVPQHLIRGKRVRFASAYVEDHRVLRSLMNLEGDTQTGVKGVGVNLDPHDHPIHTTYCRQTDIVTLRIGSGGPSEKLLQTAATEYDGKISPNGRWLAYLSNSSGLNEIYVRPFPDVTTGSQRLIGPGEDPLWGPDGDELFYRIRGTGYMVVDVDTGDAFERGTPRQLFPDKYYFSGGRNYDLAPDGRFLMITQGGAPPASPELVVVQNWFEELTRLVPVP